MRWDVFKVPDIQGFKYYSLELDINGFWRCVWWHFLIFLPKTDFLATPWLPYLTLFLLFLQLSSRLGLLPGVFLPQELFNFCFFSTNSLLLSFLPPTLRLDEGFDVLLLHHLLLNDGFFLSSIVLLNLQKSKIIVRYSDGRRWLNGRFWMVSENRFKTSLVKWRVWIRNIWISETFK